MHRIIFALTLATVLGSLAGFWALIDRGYRLGMEVRAYWPSLSAFGIEPYRRLAGWLQSPEETLIAESGFMGIGFLLTTVLMFFRDCDLYGGPSILPDLPSLRVGACMLRGVAFS